MVVKVEDIPKLLGLLIALGVTSYVAVRLAIYVRGEIEEILT